MLMTTAVAHAQDWAMPASAPNTDVLCLSCLGKETLKTIGYPPTLKFTGRFVDSERIKEIQFPFRTVRARGVSFLESADPTKARVYMLIGSAAGGYNTDSFFRRLNAQEAMVPSSAVSISGGNPGGQERFLFWDRFFYAENGGGWTLPGGDGQDRLYGIDSDDRGNVYLAYSTYGWGIVQDDFGSSGGWLTSLYQHVSGAGDVTPNTIVSCKVDGDYYAVITSGGDNKAQVWKVTDPRHPSDRPSELVGRAFASVTKDTTGARIATVDPNGRLSIYTNKDFVFGGEPLFTRQLTGGGQYKSVTTDGAYFYAMASIAGAINISVINGTTYAETLIPMTSTGGGPLSFSTPGGVRAGGGYLALWGIENTAGGWNVHLYKTSTSGALTEVPLDNYFAKYYSSGAPSGYTHPQFSSLESSSAVTPYRNGGKSYLIIESFGLGDVYEIKAGDSLTARLSSTPSPFYGDRQTFTSSMSSNSPTPVNWDFGDNTTFAATADSPTVTHQYGGATASQLPLTRHVTATSALDSSLADALNVTLAKPTAGFKLAGTSYLFRLPDSSSQAAIVTGDTFADISDGTPEGHYTEWNLDQVPAKRLPSAAFSVGACGVHTLKFVAHYGPYNADTFAASADAQFPIDSVVYVARPFAITVQEPPASSIQTNPTTAIFTSTIRTSALTADLPGGLGTPANYEWDLVDATNVNRQQLKGAATLGSIPTFPVPRSSFSSPGMKVILIVTVTADRLSAACNAQGYTLHSAATGALNGPDPTIVKTGCDHVGDPCKFTVTSATSQSGWTYDWSLNGPTPCAHCGAGPDYSPIITNIGTYTVTLNVTNGIGAATAQSAPFSVAVSLCPVPVESGTSLGYNGATSGCLSNVDTCSVNETLSFHVGTFGWSLADCNTYAWDFGDGAQSNLAQPTHSYGTGGQYTVSLTVSGGSGGTATAHVTDTIKIGSVVQPPTPTPTPTPTPGTCAALNSQTAFVGFIGSTSGCTSSFGTCKPAENLQFTLFPTTNYNFACSPSATYLWVFGDSGSASGQSVFHAFASPGTYSVSCTLTNTAGQQTYTGTVIIQGATQPRNCGTMTQTNIGMTYSGPNCSDAGGDCATSGQVQFSVVSKGSPGYDFTCDTHTYAWTFGDGGTSSSASPAHAYSAPGTYPAKVTITQGTQSIQLTHNVTVSGQPSGGGNCPTMYPDSNVYITFLGPTSLCYFGADTSCKVGEAVAFTAAKLGYDFGCGSHTYTWDFGDGQHSSDQNPTHTYTTDGMYKVTLHIVNATQAVDLTSTVKVGSGVSVPPRHRPSRH
jgi:PKD repeat protein